MKNFRKVLGTLFVLLAMGVLGYGVYSITVNNSSSKQVEQLTTNQAIIEAVEYGKSGDYKRALALLREIVKTNPKNTAALYNYGTALRGVGQLKKADETFQKLLEVSAQDYEAWAERASIAVLQNDLETGFDYLEKIPRGKGQLILRLRSDPQWIELKTHPRMKKIRAQQGLEKLTY
jgi:tetratricopeptide (TPR) repeat protein